MTNGEDPNKMPPLGSSFCSGLSDLVFRVNIVDHVQSIFDTQSIRRELNISMLELFTLEMYAIALKLLRCNLFIRWFIIRQFWI